MIKKAYIHEYGMGRMEPEHQDVRDILEARGIPVELFTQKVLDRRRLQLAPDHLVVGNHPVMMKAFRYMGIELAAADSYPESIRPFLKRNIWESTIGAIMSGFYTGGQTQSVFVKPKDSAKKFTGCVLSSPADSYLLEGASKQTRIYCSEVVNWVSEYRVFVKQGEIIGTKNYDGDPHIKLDESEVKACITTLEASPESTAGYGIDFGVLDSGETALIEWNDGFALGSYGLSPDLYTDLLIARWQELMLHIA